MSNNQAIKKLKQANANLQAKYDELNQFDKTQCSKLLIKLSDASELVVLAVESIEQDCKNCKNSDGCELLIIADSPPLCRYNEKWVWEHQDMLDKILGIEVQPCEP